MSAVDWSCIDPPSFYESVPGRTGMTAFRLAEIEAVALAVVAALGVGVILHFLLRRSWIWTIVTGFMVGATVMLLLFTFLAPI